MHRLPLLCHDANGDCRSCGSVALSKLTPAVGQCTTTCTGEPTASWEGRTSSACAHASCSTQASCGQDIISPRFAPRRRIARVPCARRVTTAPATAWRECNTSTSCGPRCARPPLVPARDEPKIESVPSAADVPIARVGTSWLTWTRPSGTRQLPPFAPRRRSPRSPPRPRRHQQRPTCAGDPGNTAGDGSQYTAPQGYYTIMEDGKTLTRSSAGGSQHENKTGEVRLRRVLCPRDGTLQISTRYFTTGAEAGGCHANLTRTAEVTCGSEHVYCPGDGKQYYVNKGYFTTGLTTSTRTGREQCGNHTYYCPATAEIHRERWLHHHGK